MHPYLIPPYHPAETASLRAVLKAAPWCWPTDRTRLEWARACEAAGKPPAMAHGDAPLVSVREDGASLWRFRAAETGELVKDASLASEAVGAWNRARIAVPRSLPVLWRSVREAHERPWSLRLVCRSTGLMEPDRVLDGGSFGLSFALALASAILGRALPSVVAASATMDEHGKLGRVDDLGRKIRFLVEFAPSVRKFLVFSGQEAEAREAEKGSLQVVPVSSLSKAFESVFEPGLDTTLVEAGNDPTTRTGIVRSFFHLALQSGDQTAAWAPVAGAAGIALRQWKDLPEDDLHRLQFARSIALRHWKNLGELPLPGAAFVASLHQPHRIEYLAHVVQEAVDSAMPEAAGAEALARRHLVRGSDAFEGHLKLLGAFGRLLAVTGRAEDALGYQQEAALGWEERALYHGMTYAVCEWLHLAAALGERAAWREAEAYLDHVADRAGTAVMLSPYLRLARARAFTWFDEHEEALTLLGGIGAEEGTPEELHCAAARHRVQALAGLGRREEAEAELRRIEGRTLEPDWGRTLALCSADRARMTQDRAACEEALLRLRAIEPEPIGKILAHGPPKRGRDWVFEAVRLYPY